MTRKLGSSSQRRGDGVRKTRVAGLRRITGPGTVTASADRRGPGPLLPLPLTPADGGCIGADSMVPLPPVLADGDRIATGLVLLQTDEITFI
jgi:hypothetical protein